MKKIFHIMIILLILDILGIVGIWYGYTLIQEKKLEEATLQTKISEEVQKGYKNIALSRTLSSIKDERSELTKFLYDPSEEGQIDFVSRIEKFGTSTTGARVETQSLVLTKEVPSSIRGDFTLKGEWGDVFYVLRLIEEFPSRLIINRFDVRYSSGEKLWSGGMQVDLNSLKISK